MTPPALIDDLRCPARGCLRKVASFDVDGDEMTVTPFETGELNWMDDECDSFEVRCRRHGYVATFECAPLKHNFRCAKIRVVVTT